MAHRVLETRWHRSQSVEEQPDGSLIWRAQVAEPEEMLPWIRGWGADVEVVAPEDLRRAIAAEARWLAKTYGWNVHREDASASQADEHRFFDDFFQE